MTFFVVSVIFYTSSIVGNYFARRTGNNLSGNNESRIDSLLISVATATALVAFVGIVFTALMIAGML